MESKQPRKRRAKFNLHLAVEQTHTSPNQRQYLHNVNRYLRTRTGEVACLRGEIFPSPVNIMIVFAMNHSTEMAENNEMMQQ